MIKKRYRKASGLVKALVLLLTGLMMLSSYAQEFLRPDVEPLTTELVIELHVSISQPVVIGESDKGVRRFIPITGGRFEGKGITGEVLDGGADWQLVRSDGVTEIKAIYAIRTDDGQVITVNNEGIAVNVPEDSEQNVAAYRYVRTIPKFEAPLGKYQWLNERVFTGTITPVQGAVIIRVFQVN